MAVVDRFFTVPTTRMSSPAGSRVLFGGLVTRVVSPIRYLGLTDQRFTPRPISVRPSANEAVARAEKSTSASSVARKVAVTDFSWPGASGPMARPSSPGSAPPVCVTASSWPTTARSTRSEVIVTASIATGVVFLNVMVAVTSTGTGPSGPSSWSAFGGSRTIAIWSASPISPGDDASAVWRAPRALVPVTCDEMV